MTKAEKTELYANEMAVAEALAVGKRRYEHLTPGRALESLHLRPGFSIYLANQSYADTTLHVKRHPRLRMWDVGPHCLLQAVDESGKVVDEAELLWHAVWWRKVAK